MTKLKELSPAALRAAMQGGTESWGEWGSAVDHLRYAEPIGKTRNWRKCYCGCGKRQTHRGMANGVALAWGCQLSVMRWVKNGFQKRLGAAAPAQKSPQPSPSRR